MLQILGRAFWRRILRPLDPGLGSFCARRKLPLLEAKPLHIGVVGKLADLGSMLRVLRATPGRFKHAFKQYQGKLAQKRTGTLRGNDAFPFAFFGIRRKPLRR